MTSNLDQLITQGFAEVGSFLSASEIDDLRARFSEVVSASPNANARQFSTSSQILLGDLEKNSVISSRHWALALPTWCAFSSSIRRKIKTGLCRGTKTAPSLFSKDMKCRVI